MSLNFVEPRDMPYRSHVEPNPLSPEPSSYTGPAGSYTDSYTASTASCTELFEDLDSPKSSDSHYFSSDTLDDEQAPDRCVRSSRLSSTSDSLDRCDILLDICQKQRGELQKLEHAVVRTHRDAERRHAASRSCLEAERDNLAALVSWNSLATQTAEDQISYLMRRAAELEAANSRLVREAADVRERPTCLSVATPEAPCDKPKNTTTATNWCAAQSELASVFDASC